ncbi:MAG: hypothetical protein BWY82_01220 [Verrucomicrobia bacterium ADurb.Bin474]|nr:MAG: hypothetical protein BWY82_01220 [Verrucomicrobia bacterium ADurb.Bin474]
MQTLGTLQHSALLHHLPRIFQSLRLPSLQITELAHVVIPRRIILHFRSKLRQKSLRPIPFTVDKKALSVRQGISRRQIRPHRDCPIPKIQSLSRTNPGQQNSESPIRRKTMGIQLQCRPGTQRRTRYSVRVCRIAQIVRYRTIRNMGRPPGFQPPIRRLESKTNSRGDNQCPDDKPSYPRASSHVITVAFVTRLVNAQRKGNSRSHIRLPEHSKREQTDFKNKTYNFPLTTIICKILSLGFIQKHHILPFH